MAQSDEQLERRGTRKRKSPSPDKVPFGKYAFLRVELTPAEKEDMKANYFHGESPMGVLADLAIPGYKVSVSPDKDHKTIIASLTCTASDDENAGCVITARAPDASTALLVLGYKVLVLCGDSSWRQVEHERGGGYSDGIG